MTSPRFNSTTSLAALGVASSRVLVSLKIKAKKKQNRLPGGFDALNQD